MGPRGPPGQMRPLQGPVFPDSFNQYQRQEGMPFLQPNMNNKLPYPSQPNMPQPMFTQANMPQPVFSQPIPKQPGIFLIYF